MSRIGNMENRRNENPVNLAIILDSFESNEAIIKALNDPSHPARKIIDSLTPTQLQDHFYFLLHDATENNKRYSEEQIYRRKLTAIKSILPKLLDSENGILIDRKNHNLKNELIWNRSHKNFDYKNHGKMDIFSAFFYSTDADLVKIHEDLSGEKESKSQDFLTDLLFNFKKADPEILKAILRRKDGNGFMNLINACANDSVNLITGIFHAIEKFIPEKERVEFFKEVLGQEDRDKFTALISACKNNHPKSVKLIFDAIEEFIPEKERAEFVKRLLTQTDEREFTPLIESCANDSPESIEIIFDAIEKFIPEEIGRADFVKTLLIAENKEGFTPLISACVAKSPQSLKAVFAAIKKFIPEGERVEFFKEVLTQQERGGFTALISACTKDSAQSVREIFDAIKEFIPEKERVEFFKEVLSAQNANGFTPLINACANNSPQSVIEIFNAIKEFIPEGGKRAGFIEYLLTQQEEGGFTALIDACANNSPESVKAIFAAIGDLIVDEIDAKEFAKNLLIKLLTTTTIDGFTALIDACTNNSSQSVREIFSAIEKFFPEGRERIDFVKKLLTQTDQMGFTALIDACANNSPESVKEIFSAIEKFIPEEERAELVKKLLCTQNENGFTALINACEKNSLRSVRMIFTAIGDLVAWGSEDEKCQIKFAKNLFKEVLETDSKNGFTSLINACAKHPAHLVTVIFDAIEEFIPERRERAEFVKTLLTKKSKKGNTAFSSISNIKNVTGDEELTESDKADIALDSLIYLIESVKESLGAEGLKSVVGQEKFLVGNVQNLMRFIDENDPRIKIINENIPSDNQRNNRPNSAVTTQNYHNLRENMRGNNTQRNQHY